MLLCDDKANFSSSPLFVVEILEGAKGKFSA
jgi:hypothetical protein